MNIDFDLKKLSFVDDPRTQKRLVRAMATTLNNGAFEARFDVQKKLRQTLKIKKRWVEQRIQVNKADVDRLESSVFAAADGNFLAKHEFGETETPEGGKKLLYVRRQGAASKANVPMKFIPKRNTFQQVTGVLQRMGDRLKVLFRYTKAKKYSKNAFFYDTAEKTGLKVIGEKWGKNVRWALFNER